MFFEFGADGIMRTNVNLSASEVEVEYTVSGNTITEKGESNQTFIVEEIQDSTLRISSIFGDDELVLDLKRMR